MKTQVYIIRHAEIVYPVDDQGRKLMYGPETHLSEEGIRQITKFAGQLKEQGIYFDKIETSPFVRAVETSEILAKVLGAPEVAKNTSFTDSYIPRWFGVPLSEMQKLMDKGEDIYLNPRSTDQEKYQDIAKRMLEGFKDLAQRCEGKSVAIVSHGDPIRLLMYRLQHPEGEIPNMSILSKDGYLKRGEAFRVTVDGSGKVIESELVVGREGVPGKREIYQDLTRGKER